MASWVVRPLVIGLVATGGALFFSVVVWCADDTRPRIDPAIRNQLIDRLRSLDAKSEANSISSTLASLREYGSEELCNGLMTVGVHAMLDGYHSIANTYYIEALAVCDDVGYVVMRLADTTTADDELCRLARKSISAHLASLDGSYPGRLGRAKIEMQCGSTHKLLRDVDWLTEQNTAGVFGQRSREYTQYVNSVVHAYLSDANHLDTAATEYWREACLELCKLNPTGDEIAEAFLREKEQAAYYGFRVNAIWVLEKAFAYDVGDLLSGEQRRCLIDLFSRACAEFNSASEASFAEISERLCGIAEQLSTGAEQPN